MIHLFLSVIIQLTRLNQPSEFKSRDYRVNRNVTTLRLWPRFFRFLRSFYCFGLGSYKEDIKVKATLLEAVYQHHHECASLPSKRQLLSTVILEKTITNQSPRMKSNNNRDYVTGRFRCAFLFS